MISTITAFETIPIDRTSIPQCELNIENKTRSNLFAWNGQFSPQFIETLLNSYAHDEDIVLDPFAGSGTTLYEAGRKGLSAYGAELNPSAYYMAKTYELINRTRPERQALIHAIDQILTTISNAEKILPTIIAAIQNNRNTDLANLLSTLIILMDLFNNELSVSQLQKKWDGLKGIVLEVPFSSAPIKINMGDSRYLNYEDDMATLLITSPPYINVFNYHQKYRRSVEALGYDVLAIAKNELGSNRKNRGNRLLTVIQYCIIKRICSATSANYPVYFFMRQASMTASDALSVVKQTTSRGVAKDKLIERLEGKNILQSKLPISSTSAGKQKETYRQQWLTESISMPIENIGYCVEALLYLSNEEIVEHDQYIRASLLGIYSTEYEKASSIIASNIRKAICRIDEGLYLED